MILAGKVYKDGDFWLSEIAALDAMTQGKTRFQAIRMMQDWVKSMTGQALKITSIAEGNDFYLIVADNAKILALMLQRSREKSGLSVRELAKRLGFKSHNSYSQYESGKTEPSLSQLEKFMKVISPGRKIELKVG